jgi:hypothetical protein
MATIAITNMLSVSASMSVQPSLLLLAYDLTVALRDTQVATVGGFHSSLERECLEILLRGQQPITICPAREFGRGHRLYSGKLWEAVKRGNDDGRVRIEPPPGVKGTRITRENAEIRNAHLLTICDGVLILAAREGSRTEAMAHEALRRGMPVFVLDHPSHASLIAAGAKIATIEALT